MHALLPARVPKTALCTLSNKAFNRLIEPQHLGLHMNLQVRPTSGLKYGIIRSHSYSKAGVIFNWRDIETSKGVFNWSVADEWVAAHEADGVEMIVDLSAPPDWAISGAAVGGAAWGGKSNMPPDSVSDWVDWVDAFSTRYAGRVHHYEGWNEPNLTKYWAGPNATYAKLVELQKALYETVKANDPTATVLSPSYTSVFGGVSGFASYLSTSDGAGGSGADWFDHCAYHFYSNDSALRPTGLERMYRGVSQALVASGRSDAEIWATETGVIVPAFKSLTEAQRTDLMYMFVPTLFALGVHRALWFAVDESNIGFAAETPAQWNDIYDAIVGKTLTGGKVETYENSAMNSRLFFSDGSLVDVGVTNMPLVTAE